jgi:hypothetical protein
MDCGQCLPCQLSLALPEAGMRFPMYRTRALSMIFSPGKRVHVLGFYDAGRISRIATLSSDARCASIYNAFLYELVFIKIKE